MIKAKIYIFFVSFFLLFFLFLPKVDAQERMRNIGFLTKNIWYSEASFFDGDLIRIYTIINNSTKEDIIGKVIFYNNKKEIGSSDFSAVSGGSGVIVWIDWQVVSGEHSILAEIKNTKIAKKDGTFVDVILENSNSSVDSIDIDFDTDKDGVGNKDDEDDDNDGLSDKEELALGTNPLEADTDSDGIVNKDDDDDDNDGLSDKEELALGTNSLKADTDGDGVKDSVDSKPKDSTVYISKGESILNLNLLNIDTDGDGIINKDDNDDDNDGLSDKDESNLGTDPLKVDTDNDGLSDKDESNLGTDPLKVDTDGDGVKDSIDSKPKDPNISTSKTELLSSISNVKNLDIKKIQEGIVPLIKKIPENINSFFEKKEEQVKEKKEEIEKKPEIKKAKIERKRIFSFDKESRDDGIFQFKKLLREKEEKKDIVGWVFLDFLNFILEKRMFIFYLSLFILFLFLLKHFKRRR